MLELARIKAITLDLDDTLWPVWPTIHRAEATLQQWFHEQAPATARHWSDADVRSAVRAQINREWAHRAHDLTLLRRESIRLALTQAGDDPALAEPAFEVFFAERQRVDLFADALPALQALSARFPVVALSNGNADVHRVGIGAYFHASVSAKDVGVGKPDPHIFRVAAQQAGVAPSEVLHIGDDAALDVVGAVAVGMQTVWVNREQHAWPHASHQPPVTVSDMLGVCQALGLPVASDVLHSSVR
jgi:FMN hydrolase / 5-amino-6-(5-phospho-D-ribitylamino)uracil phosphatase